MRRGRTAPGIPDDLDQPATPEPAGVDDVDEALGLGFLGIVEEVQMQDVEMVAGHEAEAAAAAQADNALAGGETAWTEADETGGQATE